MSERDGAARRLAVEIAEESIFEPGSPRYERKVDRWRHRIAALLARREAELVPDHECREILDLTPHFDDGRVLRVGRITRPPEGLPQEKWCLHVKTPLKPELAFCLNEPDLNYLVVVAYACLGYHTDPGWVEALAAGSEPHHYATGRYPDQGRVERDRLWCSAITATQGDRGGRMVCDVEELLAHFNASREPALAREGSEG